MKHSDMAFSILLLIGLSAVLIFSGIKMRPGIGILVAIMTVPIVMWFRGNTLGDIGLGLPVEVFSSLLQGLAYAIVISLLSTVLIEPLSEVITGSTHDYQTIIKIRGDKIALMQILALVWIFVAIIEEIIFRGFFMMEMERIFGSGLGQSILTVILISIVFGFCHAYQNSCGIITTGVIGAMLGVVFLISGKNLWVAILTHGFIDTIGIFSIYFRFDTSLRQIFWKS